LSPKKMGRPPSKDPRQTRVEAKLTEDEIKRLKHCCEVMGTTISDVIRRGIDSIYAELGNPVNKK